MQIDHIGYAVKRIELARQTFERIGFTFGQKIDDTDRNIRLMFGEKDGYRIEIVCPLDKNKKSPVDAFFGKMGATPYHICYRSDDIEAEIGRLQGQGFRITVPLAEAVAFGGKRVVFMANLGVGLMEIVEE